MPSEEELIALASKYCDESISPEEMARLNDLLRSHDLRCTFLEFTNIHVALKSETLSASDLSLANKIAAVHDAIAPDGGDGPFAPISGSRGDFSRRRSIEKPSARSHHSRWRGLRPIHRRAMVAAAAAALLAAAWVGTRPDNREHLSTVPKKPGTNDAEEHIAAPRLKIAKPVANSEGFVARVLAASKDVTWRPDGAPRDFLMRLEPKNRIKLATGLLKIEFSGGAETILHAPADFEVLGPNEARLYSGDLTGRSTAGSFNLLTPAATVIDIGTEFGVSVDSQRKTGVSVFDGEVHVRPMHRETADGTLVRLTRGMSAQVDLQGGVRSDMDGKASSFQRLLSSEAPTTLGASEISLIDVISGSSIDEYRLAGSIDPATGYWGQPPWKEPQGVERRIGHGQFVSAPWNPLVDGVFVPGAAGGPVQIDSSGHVAALASTTGATWGPIWARRRLDDALDPLASVREEDVQGFWGVGTIAAMRERLRWSRDGLVGLHSNVGIALDLQAIERQYGAPVRSLRGIVTHLERFHESSPLYPHVRADFCVFVDGELRYERKGFRRSDGDAQFGVSFEKDDRFLTIISTDSDGSNTFDHVILIDPILELVAD
jgi:hypothetical protein